MTISPTSDQLIDQIEGLLLSPRYRHGEKLMGERSLAEQFGVGRPLVREVLRRLEERGLITIIPGKGTFVREVPLTEQGSSVDAVARRGQVTPRHLIAARSMLEAEAAALAADNRTEADLDRLEALVNALEGSTREQAVVEADVAFHEAVAIASANPVIQTMFGSIRNLVHGIVIRSVSDPAVREEGVPSHRLVLDSIRDRDRGGARAAMVTHLAVAQRLYGVDLDRPLSEILDSIGTVESPGATESVLTLLPNRIRNEHRSR